MPCAMDWGRSALAGGRATEVCGQLAQLPRFAPACSPSVVLRRGFSAIANNCYASGYLCPPSLISTCTAIQLLNQIRAPIAVDADQEGLKISIPSLYTLSRS